MEREENKCRICGRPVGFKNHYCDDCVFDLYFKQFAFGIPVSRQIKQLGLNGNSLQTLSIRWKRMQENGKVLRILGKRMKKDVCPECSAFRGWAPWAQKEILNSPVTLKILKA